MSKGSAGAYDVIIIGAGISGLVCGCYLAKAGMKVALVEQHDKPGGYFTSFKRTGFLFDAAAHSFGNFREDGHVRKILTALGVDRVTKILRYDPSDIVIAPDLKTIFWNDQEKTISGLSTLFPEERDNLVAFFRFLTSASQSEFSKLKNKTFGSLLRSFFQNEKLMSVIAFPVCGNGGLPPSRMHAFSGAKIFSEFIIDGGYYPEGGIQQLPDALASLIRENSGTVLYRKRVEKILHNDHRVEGVQLASNETLHARYVVSACDMTQTFRTFLGDKVAGESVKNELKELIPSLSTFILYMGIDRRFDGLPPAGTNSWHLTQYDLDDMYRRLERGDFSNVGHMVRVSPDSRTVLAFFNAPFKSDIFWTRHKRKVADAFLEQVGQYLPSLKSHITYFDAATPSTLRRYTLNYRGAAFGWAKTPSQTFNPLFLRRSILDGLYLTGHWTSIAFGMPGACYSGFDTAKRILRNAKKSEMPSR